jgi:predicted nucleic acid-binding Zn ribbon protein
MARSYDIPVRNAILAFFKSIGMRERFEENLAIAFWDATVGKQIAQHTEPLKVIQGVMLVKVDEDVWRTELSFRKHELIQEINKKIGKKAINEIKFY